MYGYSMDVAQPIDAYHAMHEAIVAIAGDRVEGLILHVAHPTPEGFTVIEVWAEKRQLDHFNQDILPAVVQSTGVTMGDTPPVIREFDPVVVMTPQAFSSDVQRSQQ